MTSIGVEARTDRKRGITRWNRRLGWALLIMFPFSYLAAWMHDKWPDGALGSWLAAVDVGAQVIATVLLLSHAAYSFYVFGFPAPRWTLRTINGYAAYLVLLLYLLSQSAVGKGTIYTVLTIASFIVIGLHVLIAAWLAYQRPPRPEPSLREDARALVSPDAAPLEEIYATIAAGHRPTDKPALVADGLDVVLGKVHVLFDVDLSLQPGEIRALLGNNGAGKTTTLRTLAGLQRAQSGSVHLDGFDVTPLTAAGRAELGLSLVIGGNALFGPLTVEENLRMFAYRSTEPERELNRRIDRVKEMFPWVGERSEQVASTLSGGEQQMLAVSQALLVQPKVLLIDEFSLGLAPRIVGQLMELVRTIAHEGTAVLLVEQSANVALNLADRLSVMERGRIVLDEPADVLRESPDRLASVYLSGSIAAEVGA